MPDNGHFSCQTPPEMGCFQETTSCTSKHYRITELYGLEGIIHSSPHITAAFLKAHPLPHAPFCPKLDRHFFTLILFSQDSEMSQEVPCLSDSHLPQTLLSISFSKSNTRQNECLQHQGNLPHALISFDMWDQSLLWFRSCLASLLQEIRPSGFRGAESQGQGWH